MNKWKMLCVLTLAVGLGVAGTANGANWTVHPGKSIADTVLAAGDNDTVFVYPGKYDEPWPINITNTGLVLKSTAGAAACTLDATSNAVSGTGFVRVAADDVTVDGFTMLCEGGVSGSIGIVVNNSGFTITDNIIRDPDADGICVHPGANITSGTISNNTISDQVGAFRTAIVLETYSYDISGVNITDNVIDSCAGTGIGIAKTYAYATPGFAYNDTISGNTITTVGEGICLWQWVGWDGSAVKHIVITDNTISDCPVGIIVYPQATTKEMANAKITLNTITTCTDAIKVGTEAKAGTGIFLVNDNNLAGNVTYGINNLSVNVTIDATNNWWGSTAGPKHTITNPHTAGDAVSDSVFFIPWLDDVYAVGDTTGGIPTTLLISASPTSIVVGGDSSTVTATLTDVLGNPISDTAMKVQRADSAYIDFSVAVGTAYGAVSPAADTADSWGHVTTKFESLTKAGTSTVKGAWRSDTTINATVDIVVTAGPLAQVKTTPEDTVVVVTEDAIIVAELQDQYANPIAATSVDEVTFAKCDTAMGTLGTKSLTAGKIQIPYTTHTLMETNLDTITATTATGSYTDYSVVSTIGGAPATMVFWAEGDSSVVVSDTTNTLALYDSLFDAYDNPSAYSDYHASPQEFYEVIFTWISGAGIVEPDTAAVNANGYREVTYKSSTVIGDYTVTATCGAATADVTITQTVAALDSVSLTPDTATVAAGQGVTLTAELFDEFANHRDALGVGAGTDEITITKVSGEGDLGVVYLDTIITGTDSLVFVSVVYAACDTAADTASIVATASSFKDTSIVINTAPATLDHFALSVSDTMPTAGHEVTITITAEDAGNFRLYTYINPDTVTLTLDGSAAQASQVTWLIGADTTHYHGLTVLVPDSAFSSGVLTVDITNEKAEAVTVTAVDTAVHTGTSDTITWESIDSLAHYGVVVQTAPIYVGEGFTITVNPCDSLGNVTTAGLPRLIKFLASEAGVSVPSDQLLEEPTDYTVTATNATDSLTIRVSDYATPAIIGRSDTITVEVMHCTVSGVVGLADNPTDSSGSVVSIDSHVDTTDSSGAYLIAGLLADTYDIHVTHDGYYSDSAIGVAISADTTIGFTLSSIWSDEIAMKTGWNLLSVPATVEETDVDSVFPGNSAVWTYDTAYTAPTDVEVGVGYWVKYTYDTTITVTGVPATTYTRSLTARWNMIGSISEAVALSDVVVDPTGGIDTNTLWGYDPVGGYAPCDTISPLKGYWIFADSACEITVGATGKKAGKAVASVKKEDKTSDLIWTVDIEVESGRVKKALTFGTAASATSGYDSHFDRLLPPPAPDAKAIDVSFRLEDARFARCVTDIRESGDNEWKLTVKNTPEFKVSWGALDIPEDMTLTLCAGSKTVDMRSKSSISVKGISSIRILASKGALVPKVFALSRNAPNPFVNKTSISLQIPARVRTTVVIYNIAGQLVKTLMDKDTDAGYYTLSWDATDNSGRKVGSGIYFCKVQAGESTATRKLTLLR